MSTNSEYEITNLIYTGDLSRPSTDKGGMLIHTGTNDYEIVSPTATGQILSSNSATTAGAEFTSEEAGIGFSITTSAVTPDVPQGTDIYFLSSSSTSIPASVPMPDCTLIKMSITPAPNDGWKSDTTDLTGGQLDFYLGYIPANTQRASGNFIYYGTGTTTVPGSSDYCIPYTAVNTAGTRSQSFIADLDQDIDEGQGFCVRADNNMTGGTADFSGFQALFIFKLR